MRCNYYNSYYKHALIKQRKKRMGAHNLPFSIHLPNTKLSMSLSHADTCIPQTRTPTYTCTIALQHIWIIKIKIQANTLIFYVGENLIDLLFLISAGKLFIILDLELKMPCPSWLNVIWECAVNLELLTWFASWWSETYVGNVEIYSGACPVMLLYTERQVWYWTRFGNKYNILYTK